VCSKKRTLSFALTRYSRLVEIKTSLGRSPTTAKNVLGRLIDAERVANELKEAWTDIQLEYSKLIVSPTRFVVLARMLTCFHRQ
jgi:hypothetical protein